MKKLLLLSMLSIQPFNIFNDTNLKFQDDILMLDYHKKITVSSIKVGESYRIETVEENTVELIQDSNNPSVYYIVIKKDLNK